MIRFKIKELSYKTKHYRETGKPKELKKIAEETGITINTLSRLANGCENTTTKNIEILLKYFQLTTGDCGELFEFIHPKKKVQKKISKKTGVRASKKKAKKNKRGFLGMIL